MRKITIDGHEVHMEEPDDCPVFKEDGMICGYPNVGHVGCSLSGHFPVHCPLSEHMDITCELCQGSGKVMTATGNPKKPMQAKDCPDCERT